MTASTLSADKAGRRPFLLEVIHNLAGCQSIALLLGHCACKAHIKRQEGFAGILSNLMPVQGTWWPMQTIACLQTRSRVSTEWTDSRRT